MVNVNVLPLRFPRNMAHGALKLAKRRGVSVNSLRGLRPNTAIPIALAHTSNDRRIMPYHYHVSATARLACCRGSNVLRCIVHGVLGWRMFTYQLFYFQRTGRLRGTEKLFIRRVTRFLNFNVRVVFIVKIAACGR